MEEIVHVCFPLYDRSGNYSKYLAVAIYSLLKNTKRAVCIHILHDDTVNAENKSRFIQLVKSLGHDIVFHQVNIHINLPAIKSFSVGTLFRLQILQVLDDDIKKVIYMDADILVHMDIAELWEIDIQKYMLAARRDTDREYWLYDEGIINKDDYFNAGVLVLNLEKIRAKYDLYAECIKFFKIYPTCWFLDQDALNYIFKGQVYYLDTKYNLFTIQERKHLEKWKSGIYHYAGDYVDYAQPQEYDKCFLECLTATPWGNSQEIMEWFSRMLGLRDRQLKVTHLVLNRLDKKKIAFGAYGEFRDRIMGYLSLDRARDYFVDNDLKKQNGEVLGFMINSPDRIKQERKGEFLVVVMANKYYEEIKQQLLKYDLVEYVDFIDGRYLLSEYSALLEPVNILGRATRYDV